MDALLQCLWTQGVLRQMHQENEGRMRVTAISVAWEVGIELTEDEHGVLDV